MLKIELPFWMNKGELKKLNSAAQGFWDKVERWMRISLSKFDLMTCDLIIVDHVAWERKISRLDGEIESIYRKRVQFAFINAKDAGMNRGIYNIFERLGIPVYDVKERQPNKDWDIVTIEMNDDILSGNKNLVNLLIQTYGATCRRYEYSVTATTNQYVSVGEMTCSYKTYIAELPPPPGIKVDYQLTVGIRNDRWTGRWYGFSSFYLNYGKVSPNPIIPRMGNVLSIESSSNQALVPNFVFYMNIATPKIMSIAPFRSRDKNNSILLLSAVDDIPTEIIFEDKKITGKFVFDYNLWKFITSDDVSELKKYINSNENKTIPMTIYYDVLTSKQ